MSLQLTLEKTTMFEKHKSEALTSDLLGGHDTTEGRDIPFIISRPPNFDNRGFVTTDRFIKFIPGPKASCLLSKYPKAFLLLCLIAMRARRTFDPLNELEIGEAYVGDHDSCGLSRKEYRTALAQLERQEILLISLSNRNPQKSATKRAIKSTTKGTIVKLLSSDIWDLNFEVHVQQEGHLKGQLGATSGPPRGHKQERKEREEGKKKKIFLSDSVEIGLAKKLFSMIKAFEESVIEPDFNSWALHFDRMIRLDQRSLEQIEKTIDWLYKSENANAIFWRTNILCSQKLREKWSKLQALMKIVPAKNKSTANREKVLERFKNGNFYNEAECFLNEEGIAFQRGMKHQQLKFKEHGFEDQFENILRDFGIRI